MGFQHPHQHAHMMAGVMAAANSPKTPEHLKSHLRNREARMKKEIKTATNKTSAMTSGKKMNAMSGEETVHAKPFGVRGASTVITGPAKRFVAKSAGKAAKKKTVKNPSDLFYGRK